MLLFTLALATITGILFGLAPALQASKPNVVPVLKNELRASLPGRRGPLGFVTMRQMLVVVQVALSLVALIAAARDSSCGTSVAHSDWIRASKHVACW